MNKINGKNYNTLSGEVTKDTLSYEERKELEEKIDNNTIKEGEGRKLMMDDSYGSHRSTSGGFDHLKYQPNVEYFFLSHHSSKKDYIKWTRIPYRTQLEILPYLKNYAENFTDYHNLEIFSEKTLDIKGKFMCEDGKEREMTLREVLFDSRYQRTSDMVKTHDSFLKDMKGE